MVSGCITAPTCLASTYIIILLCCCSFFFLFESSSSHIIIVISILMFRKYISNTVSVREGTEIERDAASEYIRVSPISVS